MAHTNNDTSNYKTDTAYQIDRQNQKSVPISKAWNLRKTGLFVHLAAYCLWLFDIHQPL